MSRFASLPVSLVPATIPNHAALPEVARELHAIFESLSEADFVNDAVWRDSYALTGTLRTLYGATQIMHAWRETRGLQDPVSFQVLPDEPRKVELPGGVAWIDVSYTFETRSQPRLLCSAILSLRFCGDDQGWKIWIMRTVVDDLKDQPSVDSPANSTASTTGDPLAVDQYDCIIIGAGQAGLNVAARCQALGISYVVIDKNDKIGDNWRSRYDSARLHTLREYTHLPYDRTWTDERVEYLGKDDLADGYNRWAEKFGIKCCLSTALEGGRYDAGSKLWRVSFHRHGVSYTLKSTFVIMATGAGGQVPLRPHVPGEVRTQQRSATAA